MFLIVELQIVSGFYTLVVVSYALPLKPSQHCQIPNPGNSLGSIIYGFADNAVTLTAMEQKW